MKEIFEKILLRRPGELEYLRLVLESQFPKLLAEEFLKLQGKMPSKVTVQISYVHRSPILNPQLPWPFAEKVEFGDALFALNTRMLCSNHLTKELSIQQKPAHSVAFITQAKLNENSTGKSTMKQEYLYQEWPPFHVHHPKDVGAKSPLIHQLRESNELQKKSGVWVIHSDVTTPLPRILVRDSSTVDSPKSLDLFINELHRRKLGRNWDLDDDWSKLVRAILEWHRRIKLRKTGVVSDLYKTVREQRLLKFEDHAWAYQLDLKEEEPSIWNKLHLWLLKLLRCRIFWIIEVDILELEVPRRPG